TINDGKQARATFSAGTVNVRQWGAVGDGIADDTQPIQAALNYALLGTQHGDSFDYTKRRAEVVLPAGRYRTTDTLHLGYRPYSSITFWGENRATTKNPASSVILTDFNDRPALAVS